MKTIILFLFLSLNLFAQSSLLTLFDSGASFTPTDVSGLLGWYDFSDASTLYLSTTLIDSIREKSGLQGYTKSPVLSTRPNITAGQNGLNVADFIPGGDGADRLDDATFTGFTNVSNGFSVYVIAKFEAVSGQTLIEMSDNDSPNRGFLLFAESNALNLRPDGANAASGAFTDVTNYKIFSFIHAPASRDIYVNGNLLDNDANLQDMTAIPTILNIGVLANKTTYPMDGKIGEILIYLGTHTETQRLQIETYLNDKWAIY